MMTRATGWHVSPALDDRIPDFNQLTSLAGRQLILPKEPRFFLKRESLAWRLQRLGQKPSAG